MYYTIKYYEKNRTKVLLEVAVWVFLPFGGFFYDLIIGLVTLILFSPLWLCFWWLAYKKLKAINHEIVLTKYDITIEGFSSKKIPWSEIKEFNLTSVPVRFRNSLLKADFIEGSIHKKQMGKFNSKLSIGIFGDGDVLCGLDEYQESPSSIVKELNLQLKLNSSRT
mgnify:CR=1 FL=1